MAAAKILGEEGEWDGGPIRVHYRFDTQCLTKALFVLYLFIGVTVTIRVGYVNAVVSVLSVRLYHALFLWRKAFPVHRALRFEGRANCSRLCVCVCVCVLRAPALVCVRSGV